MYKARIKRLVNKISQEHGINGVPVDVDELARRVGAEIKRGDFDDATLSGFVLQKNGFKYIGVNSTESLERQRFTIAHELGHLFLHKQKTVSYDSDIGTVLLRDSHSAEGTDMKEIEANRFAAELLMPEEKIREDLANHGRINLMRDSEETVGIITELAEKYQVSYQAMSIRLSTFIL